MNKYSHRNGEIETPTEPGLYWFKGHAWDTETEGALWIIATPTGLRWYPLSDSLKVGMDGLAHFAGQWWGPVVPPWSMKPAIVSQPTPTASAPPSRVGWETIDNSTSFKED